MLLDELDEHLREAGLARQFHAARDVLHDHARALQRIEALVRVLLGAGVLDEP